MKGEILSVKKKKKTTHNAKRDDSKQQKNLMLQREEFEAKRNAEVQSTKGNPLFVLISPPSPLYLVDMSTYFFFFSSQENPFHFVTHCFMFPYVLLHQHPSCICHAFILYDKIVFWTVSSVATMLGAKTRQNYLGSTVLCPLLPAFLNYQNYHRVKTVPGKYKESSIP